MKKEIYEGAIKGQFKNLYELHEPDAMKIIEEMFDFT